MPLMPTYEKVTNFLGQRQLYCHYKNRHLAKITLITAPDGFILAILGPHFSDSRNNYASILDKELDTNDELRHYLRFRDLFLFDRGYRDVVARLRRMGFEVRMSPLRRGRSQLHKEDADEAKFVSVNRWVIEVKNGHFLSCDKILRFTRNLLKSLKDEKLKET